MVKSSPFVLLQLGDLILEIKVVVPNMEGTTTMSRIVMIIAVAILAISIVGVYAEETKAPVENYGAYCNEKTPCYHRVLDAGVKQKALPPQRDVAIIGPQVLTNESESFVILESGGMDGLECSGHKPTEQILREAETVREHACTSKAPLDGKLVLLQQAFKDPVANRPLFVCHTLVKMSLKDYCIGDGRKK